MTLVTTGAFDRFNYGDLLFPILLEHRFPTEQMLHLATRTIDMRPHGGRETLGIRDFRKRGSNLQIDSFILAGGELLGASWYQAGLALSGPGAEVSLRALRRVGCESALEPLIKRGLGGEWATPYIPDVDACSGIKIVGSAIGASSLSVQTKARKKPILESLRSAKYLSVRDLEGQAQLTSHAITTHLAPDSAAALRRVPELDKWAVEPTNNRLVFQCSRSWGQKTLNVVAEQLLDLARHFDEISLLPIGLASGHSDQTALRQLARRLMRTSSIRVRIIPVYAIGDIVAAISAAGIFVGSSLHGHITAMAYGVPSVALARIPKLNHYVATWGNELTPNDVPANGLVDATLMSVKTSRDALRARARHLQELSMSDTDRLADAALS